jgi:peptidoglycan/LPS O-acetylase OafA/YrhL
VILKQFHRNFSIKVKYRAEIDGLRAIAVVAVILFRAGYAVSREMGVGLISSK